MSANANNPKNPKNIQQFFGKQVIYYMKYRDYEIEALREQIKNLTTVVESAKRFCNGGANSNWVFRSCDDCGIFGTLGEFSQFCNAVHDHQGQSRPCSNKRWCLDCVQKYEQPNGVVWCGED